MHNEPIQYDQLTIDEQRIVDAAFEASKKAYCPYSNFPVGAAVLTDEGQIFTGCNIENAAWTPSICSERVAVSKAVSEGFRSFKAIALICASRPGGWSCGLCRQFMSEFGLEIMVLNMVSEDKSVLKKTLRELLPDSFGPFSL
jgi:cytidine deaminase